MGRNSINLSQFKSAGVYTSENNYKSSGLFTQASSSSSSSGSSPVFDWNAFINYLITKIIKIQ